MWRIDVLWPQIARSGKLPVLAPSTAHVPPTPVRAYAAELRTESRGLNRMCHTEYVTIEADALVVTGKVVAEGEQRGAYAFFDVFVKDSTGKCALTVAVHGDLRDVQTSEIIEKDVDFTGSLKDNGEATVCVKQNACVIGSGEVEFVVPGWQGVKPVSLRNNVSYGQFYE